MGRSAYINNGNKGIAFQAGVGETSLTFSKNGLSNEFIFGIDKIGMTINYGVDFENRTVSSYIQTYIRPVPVVVVLIATCILSGVGIPVFA